MIQLKQLKFILIFPKWVENRFLICTLKTSKSLENTRFFKFLTGLISPLDFVGKIFQKSLISNTFS